MKIQKLLVPVDVSGDSLTAIQIAFQLASAAGGEVCGLFVEDAELLAAGSLPFAREVGSRTGLSRPIGTADIEQRLQFVAEQARDAFAQAGQARSVQFSFRVTRGNVKAEIIEATSEADIVALGKGGWSLARSRRPGNTCLGILAESRIPVLVVERGAALAPVLVAVHDESAAGARAVDFARGLSQSLGWQLGVFAVQGMTGADEVLVKIHQEQPRLIVLPASLSLRESVSRLQCPVLFVP